MIYFLNPNAFNLLVRKENTLWCMRRKIVRLDERMERERRGRARVIETERVSGWVDDWVRERGGKGRERRREKMCILRTYNIMGSKCSNTKIWRLRRVWHIEIFVQKIKIYNISKVQPIWLKPVFPYKKCGVLYYYCVIIYDNIIYFYNKLIADDNQAILIAVFCL